MVDVLLVHAPDASGDPRKGPPLALAYLSAQLQAKGWSTRLVDLNLVSDWRRLLPAWLQVDAPRMVGISSTAFSLDLVGELASTCKHWDAAVPVIAGGYCGLLPTLRDIGALDAICVGEGDWVLCEIMENLARGEPTFGGIASLHYRGENGQWIENARRSLLSPADLDNLPFPDFYGIEPARYGEVPAVPLYVQRGCYNSCSFCDVAPFYASRRVRAMSPTRVAEWMLRAKEDFGSTHVQFMDDDFLSRPAWFAELARRIAGQDGKYAIQANFQT
ncbi:MAG TPA: cobalamin-dependent protein, partial [Candidatus Lokiarchaeia archaeon]|nr:cobalamin-dependent protein [Candidatus Lokiarchaeia archaeon]